MLEASFDATKTSLDKLLEGVRSGELQLPDFQRSWVWDDDRIRSLLASVSVSFPIGAIMTLQMGGKVHFQTRPLEGVELPDNREPGTLLLDGQQRLTSLFRALKQSEPIPTQDSRGKKIKRRYYVNMELALKDNTDRDEWIVSVPEDGVIRTLHDVMLDLSTAEQEYKHGHFPVHQMFSAADWRTNFNEHWGYDRSKIQLWDQFEQRIVKRFEQYQLPVIALGKETTKEAVCLVFEKVNTGASR